LLELEHCRSGAYPVASYNRSASCGHHYLGLVKLTTPRNTPEHKRQHYNVSSSHLPDAANLDQAEFESEVTNEKTAANGALKRRALDRLAEVFSRFKTAKGPEHVRRAAISM
jgi:hypothetical protein